MTRANCRWASGAVTDVSLPVQACRSHGRAGSAMVDETCLRCCTGISSATTRALLCAGSGSASAGSRCPNTDRWANAPAPREHGPGTATGVAVSERSANSGHEPRNLLLARSRSRVASGVARPAFELGRVSLEQRLQPRPVHVGPGLLVQIDPLTLVVGPPSRWGQAKPSSSGGPLPRDSRVLERIDLPIKILLGGRHTGIAKLHGKHRTASRARNNRSGQDSGTNLRNSGLALPCVAQARARHASHYQGNGTPR